VAGRQYGPIISTKPFTIALSAQPRFKCDVVIS